MRIIKGLGVSENPHFVGRAFELEKIREIANLILSKTMNIFYILKNYNGWPFIVINLLQN
ncbi:MAG: hypothetical protein HQK53_09245 [Oligoflexia bacterium]|nr:hypothetical protein [Oligoflexia bacterium]